MSEQGSTRTKSIDLGPGERLLWTGRPEVKAFALGGGGCFVVFAAFFIPAWVVGMLLVFLRGAPAPVFLLFGLPLVALAIYYPYGRIWAAAREARCTDYFVTNARIAIVGGVFRPVVTEIPMTSLRVMSLEEHNNGSGDIYFTEPRGPWPYRMPPFLQGGRRSPGFYAINEVQGVFRIIQGARAAANGDPDLTRAML